MKTGILLINLGTPVSNHLTDVKRYLRQFLMDKRVIDIPAVLRYLLVNALIIPFRVKNTTHAYKTIWTKHGSPLLYHSENLVSQLQNRMPYYPLCS